MPENDRRSRVRTKWSQIYQFGAEGRLRHKGCKRQCREIGLTEGVRVHIPRVTVLARGQEGWVEQIVLALAFDRSRLGWWREGLCCRDRE